MKFLLAILFGFWGLGAYAQVDEIELLLETKPETEETVIWLCDTAFTFYGNDPFTTQQVAELALAKAEEWDTGFGRARANHVIGISFWARDMYELALEHYLEALKYYEEAEIVRGVALIKLNIGTIYDDLGQSARGKRYLLESVAIIEDEQDSINLGRGLNNLAVLYSNLSKNDSAMHFFRRCMQIRKAMNDSVGVARVYNNIADVFLDTDIEDSEGIETELALNNLLSALEFMTTSDDLNLRTTIYANLGSTYTRMGAYPTALSYLDSAMSIAKQIDSKLGLQLSYGYLRQLYTKTGDYEKAYEYTSLEVDLDKEQRSAEVSKQIDQLNVQFQTERKERQLAESEKQRAEERSLRIITGILLILVLIVGVFVFLSLSYRMKRKKLATQLKIQKLRNELQEKNKEISSYTLNFIKKNEIMAEFREQLDDLRKKSDPETLTQLNKITRIVDQTFKADDEWKNFQLTFEQMHDGFFIALKEKYPDLGNAELKLCALLRLNMNLKESASILGISSDSVKTARYRLRKKFNLNTEDNLIDFLIRFEQEELVPS